MSYLSTAAVAAVVFFHPLPEPVMSEASFQMTTYGAQPVAFTHGDGPWLFDTYLLNVLIKALFFAVAAVTVDILWGYTGYLTFGQSAGISAHESVNHLSFKLGDYESFKDSLLPRHCSLDRRGS